MTRNSLWNWRVFLQPKKIPKVKILSQEEYDNYHTRIKELETALLYIGDKVEWDDVTVGEADKVLSKVTYKKSYTDMMKDYNHHKTRIKVLEKQLETKKDELTAWKTVLGNVTGFYQLTHIFTYIENLK